jgi:Rod binding domain-containing protein
MGTIGSLASEALAQAIVKQGGMGIAKMVLAQLAPVEQAASQPAAVGTRSKCGGCAPELTMTPATGASIEAGSVAMQGEGTLPASGGSQPARISLDRSARRDASTLQGERALPKKIIRPIGSLKP